MHIRLMRALGDKNFFTRPISGNKTYFYVIFGLTMYFKIFLYLIINLNNKASLNVFLMPQIDFYSFYIPIDFLTSSFQISLIQTLLTFASLFILTCYPGAEL